MKKFKGECNNIFEVEDGNIYRLDSYGDRSRVACKKCVFTLSYVIDSLKKKVKNKEDDSGGNGEMIGGDKHWVQVVSYCGFRVKNLREHWRRLETVKSRSVDWSVADERSLISLKARVREIESVYQIVLDNSNRYKVPYFINRERKKLEEQLKRDGKKDGQDKIVKKPDSDKIRVAISDGSLLECYKALHADNKFAFASACQIMYDKRPKLPEGCYFSKGSLEVLDDLRDVIELARKAGVLE